MKTNYRRKNPLQFQEHTKEDTALNYKESGGPNYSRMCYISRMRHGADVEGMEYDGGHRGNAKDIKEAKTARKRTERRIANREINYEM